MSVDEQVPQHDPAQRVTIFDTTLRDGEQSPGIHLNTREKVEIAQQLARLRVDVHRGGLPDLVARRLRGRRAPWPQEVPGVDRRRAGARATSATSTAAGEAVRGRRAPAHPHLHRHQRHPPAVQAEDGPRRRCSAATVDARPPRSVDGRRRRVLLRGRHPLRRRRSSPRWSRPPSPQGATHDQHPGHRRLHDARRSSSASCVDLYERCRTPARRHPLGALPQRPGPGRGQLAGRRAGRRPPGGGHASTASGSARAT